METSPTLLLVKGLPFSGKTEFAKKWCDAASDRVRVSWTELLRPLAPRMTKDRRVLAFEGAIHLMSEAM